MVNGQALDEGRLCGRDPPWLFPSIPFRVAATNDAEWMLHIATGMEATRYGGMSNLNAKSIRERHSAIVIIASRLIPMSEILLVIAPIPRRKPSNFSTPRRSFLDRPRHAHSPPPAAVDAWRGRQV